MGILSKYLFIYLVIGIGLLFLYSLQKRKKIKFFNYFTLILIGTLILLPHLIWLAENNYTTITYGLHRTGSGDQNFLDHLFHPIIFLGKQIGILIPFFLMIAFLVSKFRVKFNFKDEKLLFLLTINIIPIILIFLTSMVMGVKIRTMWMTPFYLFFGVLIIYIFQFQINIKKLKGFVSIFLLLFIFSPFAYAYVSMTKKDKRTDYPGQENARIVQEWWDNKYGGKIIMVIGNEWEAGNLSYHLKDRPKWISEFKELTDYDIYLCSKKDKCNAYNK